MNKTDVLGQQDNQSRKIPSCPKDVHMLLGWSGACRGELSFYTGKPPSLTDASVASQSSGKSDKSHGKHLLDKLLEGYDLDKWPTFSFDDPANKTAEPTLSYISVDIMFISSINVEAMDLTVDMYLNQKWKDRRLKFDDSLSSRKIHLKTVEQMKRIWAPDTYIVNAKQANFHHVTTENRVVYIFPSGEVFYSARKEVLNVCALKMVYGNQSTARSWRLLRGMPALISRGKFTASGSRRTRADCRFGGLHRITAKVACDMRFHNFPMDNQECYLHLASYAYTVDYLQMFWISGQPVSYKIDMDLNQFHLTNVTTEECRDKFPDGDYPCLKIWFQFERRMAHHLIQTFLPTVLIVTISWVSFYIQAEAVPARIALGITTLLTMITLNSGTKQGLPPVSYVKAIDVWMGVCTFFVFTAIWEYVVVCMLARKRGDCGKHGKNGGKVPLVLSNSYAQQNQISESHQRPSSLRSNSGEEYDSLVHRGSRRSNATSLTNCFSSTNGQVRTGRGSTGTPMDISSSAATILANRSGARFPREIYQAEMSPIVWQPRNPGMQDTSFFATDPDYRDNPVRSVLPEPSPQTDFEPRASVAEVVSPRKKARLKPKCTCLATAKTAQERSQRVDTIARFAYPAMFALFNFWYWPFYLFLNGSNSKQRDGSEGP